MNILETAASTHSPYLHPGGETMTQVLIEKLAIQPNEIVLEIGCGTGATASNLAAYTGARVIAFDQLPEMLAAAKHRIREKNQAAISLLTANANHPLPFAKNTFDAVYTESVLALTQVPCVISEIARILQPGGKLILNERIWKPDVTGQEAKHINVLSQKHFGIPAATPDPWNRNDWCDFLHIVGFTDITTQPVDDFIPRNHQRRLRLGQRLTHLKQHLKHPFTIIKNLQFRLASRHDRNLWRRLEAVLFTGILGRE